MKDILDIYSDYLFSSFGQTTATGLAQLLDGELSHDQITRRLSKEKYTAKEWWQIVKPLVRQIESDEGVLIFDDSIAEKPYSDENDIICWHWDHSKNRTVKGTNFITALYYSKEVSLPVTFELVAKTETYIDKKSGKEKRKSPVTKNEQMRMMLKFCLNNQLNFRFVLADIWFASAENMRYIKTKLKKEFIMGLKSNRKAASSEADKKQGKYQAICDLDWSEGRPITIYLEKVPYPLLLIRQSFTNEDGSTGVRYLVTSDIDLTTNQLTTIYQKRWKVEEYHRSLKQNASLVKSPTRTVTTQTNHFIGALWAFVKIEMLKVRTANNHYRLKKKLYHSALQTAFDELRKLKPITVETSATCLIN
jgi:hypothetical protein